MEHTIGDLCQEISNPFGNLAHAANTLPWPDRIPDLQQSQVNALKTMCPELDTSKPQLPKFSRDIGHEYVFLRPRDRISDQEGTTIVQEAGVSKVRRWGRLRLPNG